MAKCAALALWFEDEDLKVKLIHYNHLISAKKAAGRTKDLNDLENLPSKD